MSLFSKQSTMTQSLTLVKTNQCRSLKKVIRQMKWSLLRRFSSKFKAYSSIDTRGYYNLHSSLIKNINITLPKRHIAFSSSTSQQMAFPCIDKAEKKTKSLMGQGPEPIYSRVQGGFQLFECDQPLFLDYGGVLDSLEVAYETWGTLNEKKTNAILLHTGLSASSHAKSQQKNTKKGWWESFIGPGKPLDTDKYFIICTNIIGGCYGSTGPSSFGKDGKRYATKFPVISVSDMTRAQHLLVKNYLGIDKLYASVGSSLGGMQSLAYGCEFPEEVEKIVSVSACARSHPYSIGMRFAQRQIVMHDSHWNKGNYYDSIPPHMGMKLARAVATITYRSGPEWESRFARTRVNDQYKPAFCPDFLVETYLDHQGDKFSSEYDPNSFLYISKAMDLFDLGAKNRQRAQTARSQAEKRYSGELVADQEFKSTDTQGLECLEIPKDKIKTVYSEKESKEDLKKGLEPISGKPVLVVGVKSDILFPSWQQKEVYDLLVELENGKGKEGNNAHHIELDESVSQYGHDTFLLDVENVGGPIGKFLA